MTTETTAVRPSTVATTTALDDCGCPEFASSRRRFLQGAAALAGAGVLTAVHGSVYTQAALADSGVADNVLVVVSLRGGADGLSLVVPYSDPDYLKARPHIALPPDTLLQRDGTFGLHPAFQPLEQLWIDKKFAAVHAVGLHEPNRSHFDAMFQIEDADPGTDLRVGWLNRLISLDAIKSPLQAVQMGSTIVPTSLFGRESVLSVANIEDMYLPVSEVGYARRRAALRESWRGVPTALGRGSRSALQVSRRFEDLAEETTLPMNGATYLSTDLGRALAESARLLRADFGAEVITVDCGGWDMHTAMGNFDGGLMLRSVQDLAGNLAAFFKDLGTLADKVTVVTISEFGRRVEENANRGLDHGYGNVMLLAGAGVKGGAFYAPEWPGLAPAALIDGDLAMRRDYRSVLSEIITSRFGSDLNTVFPGFTPEPIGCMNVA
jgi:uncharacterized protein (DUF1501 family)